MVYFTFYFLIFLKQLSFQELSGIIFISLIKPVSKISQKNQAKRNFKNSFYP
jgi:hypothetical protein